MPPWALLRPAGSSPDAGLGARLPFPWPLPHQGQSYQQEESVRSTWPRLPVTFAECGGKHGVRGHVSCEPAQLCRPPPRRAQALSLPRPGHRAACTLGASDTAQGACVLPSVSPRELGWPHCSLEGPGGEVLVSTGRQEQLCVSSEVPEGAQLTGTSTSRSSRGKSSAGSFAFHGVTRGQDVGLG